MVINDLLNLRVPLKIYYYYYFLIYYSNELQEK